MSEKQRDTWQLCRQQAWGRAFLKIGRKHRDPLLLRVGQQLLGAASEGKAMTEKEGTLRMMPSGLWAVCRPGETPHEITAGDLFRIEFAGKPQLTRMKFRYSPRRGYYNVDGYPLRDGLRTAIGEHR
jgi:hypothetical protein